MSGTCRHGAWVRLSAVSVLRLILFLATIVGQVAPAEDCAKMDVKHARAAGRHLYDQGKLDMAEACVRRVLKLLGKKKASRDWEHLGLILSAKSNWQGAVDAFHQSLLDDPGYADAYLELGHVFRRTGNPDRALVQFQKAAELEPGRPDAFINAGNVNIFLGRTDNAESFYKQALSLDPANIDALVNLGVLLTQTGRGEAAVKEYRRAISLQPSNVDALSNLGSLLLDLGDPATSLETYREAILLAPEKAHLNFNLGNSLLHNGQVPEAIAAFQKAIKIDPSLLRAKCAAASLLAINGSYAEAKVLAAEAAKAPTRGRSSPPETEAVWREVGACIHLSLQIETCEWDKSVEKKLGRVVERFMHDILAFDASSHDRLQAMSTCLSPSRALYFHGFGAQRAMLAAIHFSRAASIRAQALPRLVPLMTELVWEPQTQLHLGYVFIGHESNSESLMAQLFLARHSTAHDGRRVSHCFSLRADHEHPAYMEIRLLCGKRFHDLSLLSHSQAARAINAQGIHILIDTVGHTFGGRPEVLAMQPSSLQLEVNPLGTYGSHSRRSFVSDRVATPPEYLPPRPSLAAQLLSAAGPNLGTALPPAMTYTEGLTILPSHLSLAFSNRHHHPELHLLPQRSLPPSARAMLREGLGLPALPVFVFAYLGRLHAIDTRALKAWITILDKSPETFLLLPDHPPGARENILKRAKRAGLASPERLLWNTEVALNATVRVDAMAAADLILDCPGKSDGSVAAEAGIVAAPLLTLPKRKLVGRRAASSVLAYYPQAGGPPLLEEHPPSLIARNVDDYIALATRAAVLEAQGNGDRYLPLHDVRAALLQHDGEWWTKYNRGVRMLWENHLNLYEAKKGHGGGDDGELYPLLPHVLVA